MTDAESLRALAQAIRDGDRAALGRGITLIESKRPSDEADAAQLLSLLADPPASALRVGITGVPGVGKSTFIDALGSRLTAAGSRVAVLAVDPSSSLRGGSILGDKTRMARLSVDPNAFIRPSPSAGTLGGVATRSREAMLLCEAAGYDIVLIETVGVGQSESVVSGMTDCFLALMLPGAGDELQSIKRGLVELTDIIAVNKADGDGAAKAARAAQDFKNALQYLERNDPDWTPPVLTCSAKTGDGIEEIWNAVLEHRRTGESSGRFQSRRAEQRLTWMHERIRERLLAAFAQREDLQSALNADEEAVRRGEKLPTDAADELVRRFMSSSGS